ncbi:MAG: PD-(D/E)XK nuclease family protein [Chloroflexota bacterium]|nr:PD-(D/E)XK nuclease family protein [Chloroflexota bacterium]
MPRPRLIMGDLAAIEDALAAAIGGARPDDALAPVTVLVGHALLRPYLRRALARRGVAQINVRYLLPRELAAELARTRAPRVRPRLSRWAERLLVREVAEEAGGYFAGIRGRDGFARALQTLFGELELGGFTAEGFAGAARTAAATLPAASAKLDELARLYGLYAGRRASFLAPADDCRAADPGAFEGPLFIYGVWSLAELHLRVVQQLAAQHGVTVFLPHSGLDDDAAHLAFRQRLFADGAPDPLPASELSGPPRVARSLFRDDLAACDASGVTLVSAPDTVREVWEAARVCLQWARAGIRFHEMAVVYRSAETYRALVDEIFREAGIDTYLHEGRPLAEHPLGRRVLSLLDLGADGGLRRAPVMEFLTETELPRGTLPPGTYASPSEWETFTREAGIIDGPEQWEERLQRLAAEKRARAAERGDDWLIEHAARVDAFRSFVSAFAAALAAHPGEATWAEHLAYLRGLAAAYAAGVEPIVEALGGLGALGAVRERVPFDIFCRTVRDDLESLDASRVLGEPVRSFGREGVAVVDATSMRHLRFRAVCVLGVAERAWPAPPRPDPLLLERERRELNAAGAGVLPLRTEPDDEMLTYWLAVQAASERLQVSYARAEAGGSGKHLPSHFFRATAEALEGRRLRTDELDQSRFVRRLQAGRLAADDCADALSAAEYDRTLLHAYVSGRAGGENVRALARLNASFGRALDARDARWGRALTPYDGCMSAAGAVAAARDLSPFARNEAVSPSRLEMYATCPYRYFLRYVLRIEPLDEPEAIERIDNLERGTLIHAILERFMREVCPGDPPRPGARDRHIPRLLELAREEGAQREQRGLTGRALIWQLDQRQIHEDLVRWYDEEAGEAGSGLVPRAFEVGFGPQWHPREGAEDPLASADPLVLPADGREVRLQGRIDRVDWDDARTRFRVIDYKTGKAKSKVTLEGGTALQLPVYVHAAAQLLGIAPERGEAEYFFASSRGAFRRLRVSGADLAQREQELTRIFGTIADGVDGGFFAPHPDKGAKNCRYCDYKDVCDARIERVMRRKEGDPRGQAYLALGDIA